MIFMPKKTDFATKIKALTLSFYRTNFYKILDNQTRFFFGVISWAFEMV
jgi:hypothetical protein